MANENFSPGLHFSSRVAYVHATAPPYLVLCAHLSAATGSTMPKVNAKQSLPNVRL